MKILAIIPARSGSKRIPGKNIRLLGGKPLIAWSIDVARDIEQICDVLVSTDDPLIAGIASEGGAMAPWLRPEALATDTASSVDVCLHALEWYEKTHGKVDGLLLLQPTSPFRSRQTVLRGIDIFKAHGFATVIGVSPAPSHPMLCFRVEQEIMTPFIESELNGVRTQDLPPAYVVNGAFYLCSPERLRKFHSFYNDKNMPLIIEDPMESVDLDTEWDWVAAENFLRDQIV